MYGFMHVRPYLNLIICLAFPLFSNQFYAFIVVVDIFNFPLGCLHHRHRAHYFKFSIHNYLFIFFVFTLNMSLCRTLKNPVRCELKHLRCSCCMQFKHTSCHIATPKRKTITHTNYETTIKLAKYTRTMLPLPLQVHCGCFPLPCCHSYAVRRIFLATRNTHHTFFFGAMPPTNVTVCCMYVCMCDFP